MTQNPNPNEAVTEWLTRKALKHATMSSFQNIDRSAAYQTEFQHLKTAKGQMKQDVGDIGDEIKAAYFRGLITGNLNTVIGMFKSASTLANTAIAGRGGRGGRKQW
jgi:hypothetical protein